MRLEKQSDFIGHLYFVDPYYDCSKLQIPVVHRYPVLVLELATCSNAVERIFANPTVQGQAD